MRLSKKAVVHVADNVVYKEPHGRSANVLKEGVLGRHAERRGEAVQSLEIAASSVATDAHCDGGSATATLADVFGAKDNAVGGVCRRAQAA